MLRLFFFLFAAVFHVKGYVISGSGRRGAVKLTVPTARANACTPPSATTTIMAC